MHREPQGEVGVVIQIGAGRDDPVHEPRLHQRDETAHAKAGRRHRAGERHADRHVRVEHPLGEELAALAEPSRVVGEEGVLHQVGDGLLPGDRARVDALAAQEGCGRTGHAVIL